MNILVLSKHKPDTTTQFIDATELFIKAANNNVLTDDDDDDNPGHIQQIMRAFDTKADVEHFARSVDNEDIARENYTLSVGSYVKSKDTRTIIDITALNLRIEQIVARQMELRTSIDTIVADLESSE